MYNELIDALRNCSSPIVGSCAKCVKKGPDCKWNMMIDAADAIEKLTAKLTAIEKRGRQIIEFAEQRIEEEDAAGNVALTRYWAAYKDGALRMYYIAGGTDGKTSDI